MELLIVDDHVEYIDRVIELISNDSELINISTANNYADAVEAIAKKKPHIILLDVNLPDKSGIDLLRYIKEQKMSSRIVMITNQATPIYKKQCLAMGADYFLDKSNDFEMISTVVATLSAEVRSQD
ncbi:MAG: response regulator [Chitinophagaceae bacterium]|nr:response regulator [Chitinophagaceae bacterium]